MTIERPRDGTAPASASPHDRLVQVDGLRAIAALAVVLFHYTTQFERNFGHVEPLAWHAGYGYLGVNLFFVISGFVIFMTLSRIQVPMDFIVSRFSKLFPSYWAAVLATAALLAFAGLPGETVTARETLVNLTMLQEFLSVRDIGGVFWSLQVELVFYVWMLGFWLLGWLRRPERVFAAWSLASILAAFAGLAGLKVPFVVDYFLLLNWIPWFSLGIAIYAALRDGGLAGRHAGLMAIAMAALVARGEAPEWLAGAGSLLLVWGASRGRLAWLAWRPLVYVGALSYPLYLLHEKLGWMLILRVEAAGGAPWTAIAVALAASLAVAALLHHAVEDPASHAIRRRYRARRAAATPGAFSRAGWALCCAAAIAGFGLAKMATSRLDAPKAVAATHP